MILEGKFNWVTSSHLGQQHRLLLTTLKILSSRNKNNNKLCILQLT